MSVEHTARRFVIRGRVQGVGYRYFAQSAAVEWKISGYARNLEDGTVEVYAIGTAGQLSEFAGILRTGPRFSDVRSVDVQEAALENHKGFRIR